MGCSTGHSYSDEKQKDIAKKKENEHKITIDGLGKNICRKVWLLIVRLFKQIY